MEDWEDEDFVPVAPVVKKALPKGLWDDEDADDQDVKESWEDDEDVAQDKIFEDVLVDFPGGTPNRWLLITTLLPQKNIYQVLAHYSAFVTDVEAIVSSLIEPPVYAVEETFVHSVDEGGLVDPPVPKIRHPNVGSRSNKKAKGANNAKRGIHWSEDEHKELMKVAGLTNDEVKSHLQPPKPEPTVEKPVLKPSGKAAGKKAKQPEEKTPQVDDEVLSDPVAEKLRQQRLVEEADYRSTAELFAKKGDEKSLDNFIPKSDSDFTEYAELLSHKIRPYEKSFHYIGLLKAVMRLSMTSLKAADAKEIASSVTAIANEKLKAEKEANAGKKKQGAKKKQLHVEKAEDDMVTGVYDAADDYDFM